MNSLVIILVTLFTSGALATFCNQSGQCINSDIVATSHASSQVECLRDCKKQPNCAFYTFNPTLANLCKMYENCNNLTTEGCPSCSSGHVDCPEIQCSIDGLCQVRFFISSGASRRRGREAPPEPASGANLNFL